MIPHKLSLQNFLSYRDAQEPLDFSQMHLAVLIGSNGHGKSALLDAMTWALWGKARAADDALMHSGSAEMQVSFEFRLGGQLYRVDRKRLRRGKTSKPRLDLFVWDEGEARWQPLTESNVKATERKIEEILRMDYDTFTHTAFLKQGKADAFTAAQPKKRKSILGKVLNLSQYDAYAVRAHELAREKQHEVDRQEGQLREVIEELARADDYAAAIKQAAAAELQARLQRDASARAASKIRLTVQNLENKLETRTKLARRVARARQEHRQTDADKTQAQRQLQETQALAAQKEKTATRFEQLKQAQSEEERWSKVLTALRPLEQEAQTLVREIDKHRAALENELALQQMQLQEAEAAVAAIPALEEQEKVLGTTVATLQALAQTDRSRGERLAALQVELAQAQREAAQQKQHLAALPALTSKRATVQEAVATLQALEQTQKARVKRLSELKVLSQQARQDLKRLQQKAEDLKERRAMLARGETDACPVCQRPLGEDGREHVLQEYEQELASLRARYAEVQTSLGALDKELKALQKAHRQAESDLRSLPGLQRQLAQLEARLQTFEGDEASLAEQVAALQAQMDALQAEQAHLQQAQAETKTQLAELPRRRQALAQLYNRLQQFRQQEGLLPGIRTTVWDLRSRLEAGVRPDLQKKLDAVQADVAALAYDEAAHQQARRRRQALQDAAESWLRVQTALKRLPEEEARAKKLSERWQREAEALAEDVAELAALDEALQALPEARQAWDRAQRQGEEAHRAWEQAHAMLAAAKQRLAALEGVRQQRARLDAALTASKSKMHRYQMLEKAFGRNGLQAMIVEAALPELETEANRLLARLSDGRMNVRLETQREKKMGGIKEALDIIISDELGSRPYELYSGGEAFRVDLALRIALSRLLARRAGAALQTLFIDEGFGTQDAQGREHLVEAIHMIKDEFALILVITHIEELRDQFPVQIVVEKTTEGSIYRVM